NAFLSIFDPDNTAVDNNNLVLSMKYNSANKAGFGATADASHTIKYGKVTARVKTASVAKGVVSSFIIRDDQSGDEIDFEWVGLSPNQVQTNYYFNDVLDYTKMVPYDLGKDTSAEFHDYSINWTEDSIVWSVDGKAIRTVNKADTYNATSKTYAFPSAESRIAFSIWDGGSGAQGTADWAGYPTPWNADTIYKMYVDSVTVQCNGSSEPSASSDAEESSAVASSSELNSESPVEPSDSDVASNSAASSTGYATATDAPATESPSGSAVSPIYSSTSSVHKCIPRN
ncbi:putative glycosidase CRH2, partial [Linderina macrospora]